MANPAKALPDNVPGQFFVDSTCIDCDTCRQLAPTVFGASGGYSFVEAQPSAEEDERRALHALLACPTGSIGTRGLSRAKQVMGDFPLCVEGDVYYCGFTSPKSFGGSSYFLRHPAGNWLIDAPKYLPQLVKKFEAAGGLRYIFLTHRDDVADADRYARHFAAERIIHARERSAQPDAERLLDGDEAVQLAPGFVAIPTPGHTRGHVVLLVGERYLFTGDHLWWDRDIGQLDASAEVCWHSWDQQQASMARLQGYRFEWVLPGHGDRVHRPVEAMHAQLAALVERMAASPA